MSWNGGLVGRIGVTAGLALLGVTGVAAPRASVDRSRPSAAGSSYSASGMPNVTNTGVPPGVTLTPKSSTNCDWVITTKNSVIKAVDLRGCIDVEADNVTIINSRIRTNTWWGIRYGAANPHATGLKVLHDTIEATDGCCPDGGIPDYAIMQQNTHGSMELGYNNISGYMQGTNINTGTEHDDFVHGLAFTNTSHTEDIYVWCGGNGVVIDHNTLLDGAPLSVATTALYIAPDCGHQNNVTVTNNWLGGGAYAFYGGDKSATNIKVRNNAFTTLIWPNSGYYGTDAYWWPHNVGNVWSGNEWADGPKAGQTVKP